MENIQALLIIKFRGNVIMKFEIFGREFEFFTSERQYEKFFAYLNEYLIKPPVLILLMIIILYLLCVYFLRRFEKQELADKLKSGYPVLYFGVIVAIYLLGRESSGQSFRFEFDNWLNGATQFHETMILTFIINMLVFLGYGFVLQKYWRSKKRNVLLVMISALFIEEMQYFLSRGIGSVTDFVAFTIGGVMGVFLCRKTN